MYESSSTESALMSETPCEAASPAAPAALTGLGSVPTAAIRTAVTVPLRFVSLAG